MDDATLRLLVNRMVRAAKLQRGLYAEVAADIAATRQAVAVVVISGVAGVISDQIAPLDLSWLGVPDQADTGELQGIGMFILGPITAIIAWLAWSGLAWFVGTRMIAKHRRDVQYLEVARALGYAQAPSILGAATFIPGVGLIIFFGVRLWLLATGFVAIRESMGLSGGEAVATTVVSVAALIVIPFLIVLLALI